MTINTEWAAIPDYLDHQKGGIAATTTHLYYINGELGSVFIGRMKVDGTENEPEWVALGSDKPTGLLTDGTHLFWSIEGDKIVVFDLASHEHETLIEGVHIASPAGAPIWAISGTHIYWLDENGGKVYIARVERTGSGYEPEWRELGPTTAFPEGYEVNALAGTATDLYLLSRESGWPPNEGAGVEIHKLHIAGGEPELLWRQELSPEHTNEDRWFGVAVTGEHLYFLSESPEGTLQEGKLTLTGELLELTDLKYTLGEINGVPITASPDKDEIWWLYGPESHIAREVSEGEEGEEGEGEEEEEPEAIEEPEEPIKPSHRPGRLLHSAPDPLARVIDPTRVWVRHVVRGTEGEPSAKTIGRAVFVRADVAGEDGIDGEAGWQNAEVVLQLEDDDSFTLVLPNIAGRDGILHRRRFRVLTDPEYEPGEEWLEFWNDPNDLMMVGTPTEYLKTPGVVTIKGKGLTEVLAGSLSSEVDQWDSNGPLDVIRHYTRIPVLVAGRNLSVALNPEVRAFRQELPEVASDCWSVEARMNIESQPPPGKGEHVIAVHAGGEKLTVDLFDGSMTVTGFHVLQGRVHPLPVPGPLAVKVVARYERIFVFLQGELIGDYRREVRREEGPFYPRLPEYHRIEEVKVAISHTGLTLTVLAVEAETLEPFAFRRVRPEGTAGAEPVPAADDLRLAGDPPADGLRAQFYSASAAFQHGRPQPFVNRLADEPAFERVDKQIAFAPEEAVDAPGVAGAVFARWSGAIWLPNLGKPGPTKVTLAHVYGRARLYLGWTLPGFELLTSWWNTAPYENVGETNPAEPWLPGGKSGERGGWYPIVIEYLNSVNKLMIELEVTVEGEPAEYKLSPIGCYSGLIRNTFHRQVIADTTQAFGYQWRTRHEPLEGLFPGQLEVAPLIGRQTDVVVDDKTVGTEAQVQGNAADVIDGIVADAAGIANPKGAGQLSAQVVDYSRREHLALRQAYDSVADITELPLLRLRIDSLLALRSSPNEQVGARPRGQEDLVDTFPLEGALAKMRWRPGDGVRLALDSIDVRDDSPRQLTSVTWPLKPDGKGVPVAGFRQRPRNIKNALLKLGRVMFSPRRAYQGQIAILTGTIGGAHSTGEPVAGMVDGYSRVPLPADLKKVVKAIVAVQEIEGSGWHIEITGETVALEVIEPGRYDVTGALKAAAVGVPSAFARLVGGGSGFYVLTFELSVTV